MILVLHKGSSSCGEGLGLSNRFVAFVGTLRVLRSLRSHLNEDERKLGLLFLLFVTLEKRIVLEICKK
jgi:hypothetical protein